VAARNCCAGDKSVAILRLKLSVAPSTDNDHVAGSIQVPFFLIAADNFSDM